MKNLLIAALVVFSQNNNIVKSLILKISKTSICFAIIVCCFINQVNAQIEFAPIGAEWHYTYAFGCCPEEHFNHIVSEKDTIIEGYNCRILKQYYDNSAIASERYIIKQEQGKVYYYFQDQFNLFLDFDTKINDTIEFAFMYKKSGKDTVFSARFRVESIVANDQSIKTITTKVLEEDVVDFFGIPVPPYEYHTYTYTEKIGLHREFMPMFDNLPQPAIENFKWLRCYSDTDFSIISDEWAAMSLPCNYRASTGINILRDERNNMMVYPNPFDCSIFVFANNKANLEIIDVSGKIVSCSKLSKGINEISTAHFIKGVYFVKIQNKDNSIQTFKIIKP